MKGISMKRYGLISLSLLALGLYTNNAPAMASTTKAGDAARMVNELFGADEGTEQEQDMIKKIGTIVLPQETAVLALSSLQAADKIRLVNVPAVFIRFLPAMTSMMQDTQCSIIDGASLIKQPKQSYIILIKRDALWKNDEDKRLLLLQLFGEIMQKEAAKKRTDQLLAKQRKNRRFSLGIVGSIGLGITTWHALWDLYHEKPWKQTGIRALRGTAITGCAMLLVRLLFGF